MSQNAHDNSDQPDATGGDQRLGQDKEAAAPAALQRQGSAAPRGPVPLEYSSTAELAPASATFSLVAGIASLAVGLLAAVPAIIYARSAMREIAAGQTPGWGRAKAGLILGIVGTVWGVAQVVLIVQNLIAGYAFAMKDECVINMRFAGGYVSSYANEHEGFAPLNLAQIYQARLPNCPKSGLANYVYLPPAARLTDISNRGNTVLMYEPVSNHGDGAGFLMADGHCEYIQSPLADQMIRQLAFGANPPPALLARTTRPLLYEGSFMQDAGTPATSPATSPATQAGKT